MKIRPANLFWIIALVVIVGGIIYVLIPPRPDVHGQELFVETRQSLRQQGFKTDLADFDFSTPPEMRLREAILKATEPTNRFTQPFRDHPNLMEIIGTNSAIVVWKQTALKRMYRSGSDEGDELTWDEFREALGVNHAQVDAACIAILSGPIGFNLDSKGGNAILLPHLSMHKNLTQTLGSRLVLALHDGDEGTAFTNLLAATRLVTAWKVEPAEISHMVQFADTKIVFNATWQALQTNNWPDEQLARIQAEWESVNFDNNLAEIVAFQRASCIAAYDHDRAEILHPSMPFIEFLRETWFNPMGAWYQLQSQWRERAYLHGGKYDEEKDAMLFYRDREMERRSAVQAPTWMQMRQLPGVTNEIPFQSKYNSRVQALENLRRMGMAFQRQGSSFLGRSAETEALRRVIITALALERYHGKHGSYPNSLTELPPEFLKTPLPDFMDGQPLRYRLTEEGHFLLYSVGQDCVDNGGKMPRRMGDQGFEQARRPGAPLPEADIAWPLPASEAAIQELHQREVRAEQSRIYREQQQESADDWKQSPLRQSRVAQILATKWSPILGDEFFGGRPASEFLRNPASISNQLSLSELMTPRQVITGNEPADLTFEFPVSYDAITNHGFFLLLDAETNPEAMFLPESGAKVQERIRAANGDCLLIWHTIFDPPGRHALQVELTWYNDKGAETWCRGPAIAVTTSNLCQFSYDSSTYDVELGSRFHARLTEKNGIYCIECLTTNGEHLTTLNGITSNGEFNVVWNLVDDHGHRLNGETFNSIVHITLPDSGRSQTLKGP